MFRKSLIYTALVLSLTLSQQAVQAQQSSVYNYTEAFNPIFYTSPGTVYRSAAGKPGHQYWQNRANYSIKAQLNDKNDQITAVAKLEYTNNSPDALDYIWIQLDQNLFKPDSRGQQVVPIANSRYGDAASKFEGGYHIESVKLGDHSAADYIITDTRMQVRLQQPLAANGGKISLEFSYTYTAPKYGADRTGILDTEAGKIYAIAQWFPRVAVYDDVLGWNTHPYTGPGEFYLDYGDYQVEITAPANHIVVMGAELLNPQDVFSKEEFQRYQKAQNSETTVLIRTPEEVKKLKDTNKKLTWKYALKNARDVAWASSSAFILDGARINLPSGAKALALSAFPAEVYGNNAWERSTEYAKASIEHYSKQWFEYPYPVAVNVASNVGGMEYPAINFCGSRAKGASLWGVTDHEFGHNWFPMIVGSNERLHGWMDEGFNSFINEISTEAFNQGEYKRPSGASNSRTQFLSSPALEPIMSTPQNMKERHIGTLVYYKPAFGLKLLRNEIIGQERFDYAFRKYIADWAYKHPRPEDFFRSIENSTGENLAWFWRGWFVNNWQFDQAVKQVTYIDGNPKNGVHIEIENLQKLTLPTTVEATSVSGKKTRIKLPVEIWERNSSWTFKLATDEELQSVVIDPDQVYPDMNADNNIWIKK